MLFYRVLPLNFYYPIYRASLCVNLKYVKDCVHQENTKKKKTIRVKKQMVNKNYNLATKHLG